MITHIIYISIILFLFFWLCRAYDFANRKHRELIRYKDSIRVPFEILSHYDKAYVEFHKWMKENKISHLIINMFEKMFIPIKHKCQHEYKQCRTPVEEFDQCIKCGKIR